MVNETGRIESQLERLLSQDLTQMGYQARIRHKQRIEGLRALQAAESPDAESEPERSPAPVVAGHPTGV